MDPIKPATLRALDFEKAAVEEAQAWRNLLPPEPWVVVVGKYPKRFGEYARHRLESGAASSPSVVSRARKPHQQTRPVPVVGIVERIALRALCNQVLSTRVPVDRSPDAYRRFVAGPIQTAFAGKRRMRPREAATKYVIESDIAAFYEYVDHSRLLDELQLRTSTVEGPRCLIQLLTEIQGRPFGLPQLLDPSDELSEVYVRIVERELRRRGIRVWRYNDDFRLTADTYEDAQAHVEALAQEASEVGLVLNERKTRIVKFVNYFWRNWLEPPSEGDIEFKPELIRISNDYGDLEDDELAEVARETFGRLKIREGKPNYLDLNDLSLDDNHALTRAIGIATRQVDAMALPHVPRLFEFAPHLSHRLGTYLVALPDAAIDIGPTWDKLVGRSAFFNAWQRVWLVYVARAAVLLGDAKRQGWVETQRADDDALLRAEATLALAPQRLVTFDDCDRAVRSEPEALLPWYALAAKAIPNVSQTRLQALKDSHGLVDLLLYKPPRKAKKK